jgi:hypothetical protein
MPLRNSNIVEAEKRILDFVPKMPCWGDELRHVLAP